MRRNNSLGHVGDSTGGDGLLSSGGGKVRGKVRCTPQKPVFLDYTYTVKYTFVVHTLHVVAPTPSQNSDYLLRLSSTATT